MQSECKNNTFTVGGYDISSIASQNRTVLEEDIFTEYQVAPSHGRCECWTESLVIVLGQ